MCLEALAPPAVHASKTEQSEVFACENAYRACFIKRIKVHERLRDEGAYAGIIPRRCDDARCEDVSAIHRLTKSASSCYRLQGKSHMSVSRFYRCQEILYTNHCALNDVLERLHDQLHLPAASHATSRCRRMDRLPDFGSSLGEKVSVMFVMEKILGAASSFALLVSADSEAG